MRCKWAYGLLLLAISATDLQAADPEPSVKDLPERDLPELVVKKKRGPKYSKKNNPAVELMRKVRSDRESQAPENVKGYSYDYYDKMVIGINDVDDPTKVKGIPLRKKQNLSLLIDTAIWTGNRVLDLAVKEKRGVRVNTGGQMKEVITAQRGEGIDRSFNDEFTRVFFEDILRDIDIYDNDIKLLRNTFVSPLSAIGADYYKYYIADTVYIGTDRCVELTFAPHNPEYAGFNGRLFIPVDDSVKYVRRAIMRLPKAANVNYVKELVISQTFRKDSVGKVHKVLDDTVIDLQIMPGTPRFYLSRQGRRDGFGYEGLPEYDEYTQAIGDKFIAEDADTHSPEEWMNLRMIDLTYAEANLFSDISPFKSDKLFYWLDKILQILVKGYIPTSNKSYFDIGPIFSIASYTKAGGWKVQLGGMTTTNLSPHFFARGFVGYGFGDKKWKYGAEVEYSFNKKKNSAYDFPINSLKGTYSYDMYKIGQIDTWDGGTSLFTSLTRTATDLVTYRRLGKLEYQKEWRNNLTLQVSANYERQEQSPWVRFVAADGSNPSYLQRGFLKVGIRFAPGEKVMSNAGYRVKVNRDAWIFTMTHEFGPKNLFGSRFTYFKSDVAVDKRLWLSAFGFLDMNIAAGKIWSQVPFINLCWQKADLSYVMNPQSFSLLDPMEFAMDQYASWMIEYHLRGLLLNKIPLIKKAKLREVVGFRGFVGSLTKKNNPAYHDNLYAFPDAKTIPMGKTPYMEVNVGLENILTFLRVDYVWRLTYRDRPGISRGGVRVSLSFDF